jgi:DNA-binding MarR family transcriptional regulator
MASDDDSGSSDPQSALDGLEILAFALVSLTGRALAERGSQWQLTFQQWRALVVLGHASGPLRIGDLGKRISASGPSISRIVQRLEDHGLVEARVDRRDRRVVLVRLSRTGMTVRADVVGRRRELIRELIGEIADRPLSPGAASLVSALEAAI